MLINNFLFVCLYVFTDLLLPAIVAELIDKAIIPRDFVYLWQLGVIMLLLSLFGLFMTVFASFFSAQISAGFARDLRSDILSHIQKLSVSSTLRIGYSSLITRTTNDITQVQNFVSLGLRLIIMAPLMGLGGIVMAYWTDRQFTIIFLAVLVFMVIIIAVFIRFVTPHFIGVQEKLDNLATLVRESILGQVILRTFGRTQYMHEKFQGANEELTNSYRSAQIRIAALLPLLMLLMNLTAVVLIYIGSQRISFGTFKIGALVSLLQYAILILFTSMMAAMLFASYPRARISMQRIYEVFTLEANEVTHSDASEVTQGDTSEVIQGESNTINNSTVYFDVNASPSLEFRQVNFHYPFDTVAEQATEVIQGTEKNVLKNIYFKLEQPGIYGIIGNTGAGKSSLLHLIPRLYEPSSGNIFINGHNIAEIPPSILRPHLTVVPQNPVIFAGTIAACLRDGNAELSDAALWNVLDVVDLTQFVRSKNEGLGFILEEAGNNLSGGQRKRIAIARALLRKTRFYIFDDIFSSLDFTTEKNIRKYFAEHLQNNIVLIASNRISALRSAHTIFILDHGTIVAQGTHVELIQSSELYREIAHSQDLDQVEGQV